MLERVLKVAFRVLAQERAQRILAWLAAAAHWCRGFDPRPKIGCVFVVRNLRGDVLLVRHTYRSRDEWTLPAGGIGRDEDPLEATRREIAEEVGCVLENLKLSDYSDIRFDRWHRQTYLVSAGTTSNLDPDGFEIAEAGFFPLDRLPAGVCSVTAERLQRVILRESLPIDVPPLVRPEYVAKHLRRFS